MRRHFEQRASWQDPSQRQTGSVLRRASVYLAALCWLIAVVVGFGVLLRYQFTEGEPAQAPSSWPAESAVPLDGRQPTLLVVAHPKCPCSSASIEELARLMANCRGKVTAHVLFLTPSQGAEDWESTALRRKAEAISGVSVTGDLDGREARRFGVATSGSALLYRPDGRLAYSGGLTGSRGHSGDNLGRSTLESWILEGRASTDKTDVYGCGMSAQKETACPTEP